MVRGLLVGAVNPGGQGSRLGPLGHSHLAVAGVVIPLLAGAGQLVVWVLRFHGVGNESPAGSVVLIAALLACVAGFALSIAGLLRRSRKKGIAILGLLLNPFVYCQGMLLPFLLYLYLWAWATGADFSFGG